jgi:ADP-ribosyl-[dinitrogen reductase] hydrolase
MRGGIACEGGSLDVASPLATPIDPDRVEGMLLGLAVGNALGLPTEGRKPHDRSARFGEIRDYLPESAGSAGRGIPNVDTQMTFLTVEQILSDGCFDPANVVARFCSTPLVATGGTLDQFVSRACHEGRAWHKAGLPSAGNGALMRIAPVMLPTSGSLRPTSGSIRLLGR